MIRDLDVDVVDQYDDVFITREPSGEHGLMNEDGDPIPYEEAPRKARFLYDRRELKRQGQQELAFAPFIKN